MNGDNGCDECGKSGREGLCEDCLSEYRVRGFVDISGAFVVTITAFVGSLYYEFNTLVVVLLLLVSVLLLRDGAKHYRAYRTHRP